MSSCGPRGFLTSLGRLHDGLRYTFRPAPGPRSRQPGRIAHMKLTARPSLNRATLASVGLHATLALGLLPRIKTPAPSSVTLIALHLALCFVLRRTSLSSAQQTLLLSSAALSWVAPSLGQSAALLPPITLAGLGLAWLMAAELGRGLRWALTLAAGFAGSLAYTGRWDFGETPWLASPRLAALPAAFACLASSLLIARWLGARRRYERAATLPSHTPQLNGRGRSARWRAAYLRWLDRGLATEPEVLSAAALSLGFSASLALRPLHTSPQQDTLHAAALVASLIAALWPLKRATYREERLRFALRLAPLGLLGLAGQQSASLAAVTAATLLLPALRLHPYGWRRLHAGRRLKRLVDGLTSSLALEEALPQLDVLSAYPCRGPRLIDLQRRRVLAVDMMGVVQSEALPEWARTLGLDDALVDTFRQRLGPIAAHAALEDALARQPQLQALAPASDRRHGVLALLQAEGHRGALLCLEGGLLATPLSVWERRVAQSLVVQLDRHAAHAQRVEEALSVATDYAMQTRRLEQRCERLGGELSRALSERETLRLGLQRLPAHETVSLSAAMREWGSQLRAQSELRTPLVIECELGTDIEALVRQLATQLQGSEQPLVRAHAAAHAAEQLAALYLGHESAGLKRTGWLELARGGLFVAEGLASLPHGVQATLAQALAEGRFRPVGSPHNVLLEARFVWVVQAPLESLRLDPRLAEWLQTRLAYPTLRERPEDLPSLALTQLTRSAQALGLPPLGIAPSALKALQRHAWPGNERELAQVLDMGMQSALQRGDTRLTPADLALSPYGLLDTLKPSPRARSERDNLRSLLEEVQGNRAEAARRLGVKRTTLSSALKRHGLEAS